MKDIIWQVLCKQIKVSVCVRPNVWWRMTVMAECTRQHSICRVVKEMLMEQRKVTIHQCPSLKHPISHAQEPTKGQLCRHFCDHHQHTYSTPEATTNKKLIETEAVVISIKSSKVQRNVPWNERKWDKDDEEVRWQCEQWDKIMTHRQEQWWQRGNR